ncbi:MAG: uncharacterized membrane protein YccF (DUF307 family) [Candidatus Nanohaloarchaea archaeon]|jgi:uncharacterized membrane protein YccF (DUF307 family)
MTEENNSGIISEGGSPNIVIRALWFIFLGWEITAVWLLVAWILNVTVIFLPVGLKMISWTPKVLTLKDTQKAKEIRDGEVRSVNVEQTNILLRAVYFVLIGWWLSLIWMITGYLVCLTVLGLPLGIWMLNRLPEITTLYRSG